MPPLPIASIRTGCRTTSTARLPARCGIRSTQRRHALLRSPDAAMEAWTLLGSLAARRRFNRVRLGVGVTDTGKRHPAVTAQAAATLNLMTRGRAILGIGPGERVGNEPYGVDWSKPVARFEEALATIRALWNSKGQLVKRDSPFFPLRDAIFDLPPYKGKWPEIWIAAHGPRMLRATGRYGDAWFPGFAHRPQDYAKRLQIIRTAASDAGRDPMSITPAFWMPVDGRVRAVMLSTPRWTPPWSRRGRSTVPRSSTPTTAPSIRWEPASPACRTTSRSPWMSRRIREKSGPGAAFGGQGHGAQRHRRRCARPGRGVARPRRALHRRGELRADATPSLRTGLATLLPFNKVVRGLKRL